MNPAATEGELFDVVNDRDEVIGHMDRRHVHERGLKHRAVHVLVFNASGELFLQKRSRWKDCFPGCWDSSASGHVESGETYDDAASRELAEELGLSPERPLERLFKLVASEATGWEFAWVYRGEGESPFALHPDEIESGGWFSIEAIDRWLRERPSDFAGGFSQIWSRWLRMNPGEPDGGVTPPA